jgi:hypothetical protein
VQEVGVKEQKAVASRFVTEKPCLSIIPPYVIADNVLRTNFLTPIEAPKGESTFRYPTASQGLYIEVHRTCIDNFNLLAVDQQ